jgi:hypothetical protein
MNFLKKVFGDKKGNKPENYLVYCILCKVEHDREKLHFLDNWMKCYAVLDKFLSDCSTKTISSDQVFCKIKSIKDKKYPRTSDSKAPTGGLMKWNENNNREICTKHLETLLEQIETAAQVGLPLQEWIVETQFPEIDTYVKFGHHEVLASIKTAGNLNKADFYDFIFRVSCSPDTMRNCPANQQISIFVSERYVKLKGKEAIETFVREIGQLAHAVKIGTTQMPLFIIERTDSVPTGELFNNLIWRDYGDIFNLKFKSNPAGNVLTIFE